METVRILAIKLRVLIQVCRTYNVDKTILNKRNMDVRVGLMQQISMSSNCVTYLSNGVAFESVTICSRIRSHRFSANVWTRFLIPY